jgi:hypothetical protein
MCVCYVMGIDRNNTGNTQTVRIEIWMKLRNGQLQNFYSSRGIFRMTNMVAEIFSKFCKIINMLYKKLSEYLRVNTWAIMRDLQNFFCALTTLLLCPDDSLFLIHSPPPYFDGRHCFLHFFLHAQTAEFLLRYFLNFFLLYFVDSHSCAPFHFFPSVLVDNFAFHQRWFLPLLSVSTSDQSPV